MNPNQLKQKSREFTRTPYFPFLVAFVACGLITILALRHNNTTMIRLRDDVYSADKAGTDVNVPLNKLRSYVYGHMNTNLSSGGNGIKPPVQLANTYARLQQQAEQQANNSALYTQAENYCQAQIPASVSISGRGRVQCVSDYVLSHGGNAPKPIPAALYQFDFTSPSWSPDLAGWSLLATVLLFIAFVISFIRTKINYIASLFQ